MIADHGSFFGPQSPIPDMKRRTLLTGAFGLSVLFGFFRKAVAQPPITQPAPPPRGTIARPEADLAPRMRIREGTVLLGKQATFQQTGSRITMFADRGAERYICLENANLQRILESMRASPVERTWSIDGMITEFQGDNYILIQRAVLSMPSSTRNTPTLPIR